MYTKRTNKCGKSMSVSVYQCICMHLEVLLYTHTYIYIYDVAIIQRPHQTNLCIYAHCICYTSVVVNTCTYTHTY